VSIHLVEMMPGLFAAIIESHWRGLGAITVTLRRDFSELYVFFGGVLQLKAGCKALPFTCSDF